MKNVFAKGKPSRSQQRGEPISKKAGRINRKKMEAQITRVK